MEVSVWRAQPAPRLDVPRLRCRQAVVSRWEYIVAYTGTVDAETQDEAEQLAWDGHLLLAETSIDVERKDTDEH